MYPNICRSVVALSLVVASTACTTLDSLSVARTDRLNQGQFYMTYDRARLPSTGARIGLLPVSVQPNMDSQELWYSRDNPALQALAAGVTTRLNHMRLTVPIDDAGIAHSRGAPGLYIGSSESDNAPDNAEIERESHETYAPMVAHLAKGSANWRREIGELTAAQELDYVVRIWISFAQYPKANKGVFGKKVVLGTHYEEDIRFLSALDKPVEVLQVSGYLLDRNGDVIRAGAEGVIFSDTPFWMQVLEVQKVIDDESLARALNDAVREDLPGRPASLDVALRHLMSQLTNQPL